MSVPTTPKAPIGDPRMAGGIRRWHIFPVIQQQTVAEHGWNVARILLAMWPEAPREMIVEALFNDTGEIATGDPPSTLKQRHPVLRDMYSKMEHDARVSMALPWGLPAPLTAKNEWARCLKMADMIEMMEYAASEIMLGNRYMRPIYHQLQDWVTTEIDQLPEPILTNAANYVSKRLHVWDVPA